MGKLSFHATSEGKKAEGMVKRGEIGAVSIGYRVTSWRAEDGDGNSVDPDDARWDDDLTFTATRWELLEASLVCVPADNSAMVRSLGGDDSADFAATRARMLSRQRMVERMSAAFRRSR
jgi:phage head maturation protease